MSDFEQTRAPAEGALQPPLQRQATSWEQPQQVTQPMTQPMSQPMSQQRAPGDPHDTRRFDVYGNPISTADPVLILQNTTYTSGRATTSMLLGLLSLVIGGPILGVPAMILSSSAEKQ